MDAHFAVILRSLIHTHPFSFCFYYLLRGSFFESDLSNSYFSEKNKQKKPTALQ
ncbi:hypothetical protein CHCC20491_2304 [Bacillus paralicheniformis]|nr:hypothetical protein SC10_B2orf01665 [Bacillus paralicheniformis]TWN89624.1 hypothetical protein CHCC20491_2304 [Bacillus paralicheniformis]